MTQRILVTAGAAGIGRAIAEAFLADGADVAICDVDSDQLAAMQEAYPTLIAGQVDVTNEAEMDAFLQQLKERWQGIDVVCANAGTGGPAGRIETLDFDEWQHCVATNLHGSFLTCRWAARLMRAQGSGLICLTSSTAGQMGYPLRSPYASAKWAIVGLTKTLAMELGEAGVRVNAICPGAVEGPRMDRVIENEASARRQAIDAVRQSYVKGVSMKTWVTAQDVANTIRFLASPSGSKISGQILAVDGHTETLAP
ncbi:SDR family oxidoreductase [Yoonia sp.]|jgi:NAD(P)-dependent dehydrogenase (short-subunit alcohol dehydrogenase family)|uniref:SDR family oxidoreductase n=1 Tax=Yoonia sp. TaxID=2212373 RepID=UPI0023157703|nr:SDR family oxidoreductase [Yoonia sp.]MDA9062003.1 SDR family oxidoreductase [Planktomarina temperata]MDB4112090.1 SDR family oxidoreductase [Yoonia sp.]MDB4241049.1 SDR family oxidoreductase [Yoonia sp.]MDP4062433.1 Levodione reductase [Rhodobacteraceae bacterium LE17]